MLNASTDLQGNLLRAAHRPHRSGALGNAPDRALDPMRATNNRRLKHGWLVCVALFWSLLTGVAWGHPPPERFDAQTWSALRAEARKPAIVVFTTAHCPTCPEVFSRIAQWRASQMPGAPLLAVLMDGADPSVPDPTATTAQRHLRAADRLFAFEGPQAALRYSVDPTWRGVTPYVALIPATGPVTFSAGPPSESQWAAWKASASQSAQIRR
jgi:hypothetical protein